jgi:hypothetical protein
MAGHLLHQPLLLFFYRITIAGMQWRLATSKYIFTKKGLICITNKHPPQTLIPALLFFHTSVFIH